MSSLALSFGLSSAFKLPVDTPFKSRKNTTGGGMNHGKLSVSVLAFFFSVLALAEGAEKGTLDLSKAKSNVEFLAVGHPSALKIKGTTVNSDEPTLKGTFKITPTNISGTATYRLERLDTGIDLRTRHMKEKYLEVEKHPEGQFELTKLPGKFTEASFKEKDVPFEGVLSLHGVKKPIKGLAQVQKKDDELNLDLSFKTKVSDFNITEASFMGITMADEVTVKVAVEGKIL
jgi:polyisoprenoid-binding protein YceI